jgi:hypothetical protein
MVALIPPKFGGRTMTEKEFDNKVEAMAARFEGRVESAADRLDKGLTYRYNQSRLFRFITTGISIAAEIGLLVGAKHLGEKGCRIAAIWCAGLGAAGLAAQLIRLVVFRREK